jgi:hypothetical protein
MAIQSFLLASGQQADTLPSLSCPVIDHTTCNRASSKYVPSQICTAFCLHLSPQSAILSLPRQFLLRTP